MLSFLVALIASASMSHASLNCRHFFGFSPKYGFAVPQKNPQDLKSIFYSNVYSTAQGKIIVRNNIDFVVQDSLVVLEGLKNFLRGKSKDQITSLLNEFENEYRAGILAHILHIYGNAQPLIQFVIKNGAVIDSRALSYAMEIDTNLLDQLLQIDNSQVNTLVPYSGDGFLVDIAISRHNVQAVRILRKHGATIDQSTIELIQEIAREERYGVPFRLMLALTETGDTAFEDFILAFRAIKHPNRFDLLNAYLNRHALQLRKSDLGRLLRESITDQRIFEVKLLLDSGASPNDPIINPSYLVEAHSPLELAIRAGNVDIVYMLRTYGANLKDPTAYPEPMSLRDAITGSTSYVRLARRLHPQNKALQNALK